MQAPAANAAHPTTTNPTSGRVILYPTRLGAKAIGFYLVLLVTFFAIPYANLFFLGMAFLSVIGMANVVWALRNLRGVQVSVTDVPPAPAGQPIPLAFTVSGRRRRVAFLLAGSLEAGGARCRTTPADIPAGGGVLLGELPPLPRGVYAIHRASVESPYPHGLVRAARSATAPRELIVYPAPLSPPGDRTRRALIADIGATTRDPDHGSAALRDWRTGDDPRRVHWKATARRGHLVVRDPDDSDTSGSEIVLDRRCSSAALEGALSTIAWLALIAEQRKERLALHTQGLVGTYGSGAAAMQVLWRALAALQPLPADAAPPPAAATSALRLPRGERR